MTAAVVGIVVFIASSVVLRGIAALVRPDLTEDNPMTVTPEAEYPVLHLHGVAYTEHDLIAILADRDRLRAELAQAETSIQRLMRYLADTHAAEMPVFGLERQS